MTPGLTQQYAATRKYVRNKRLVYLFTPLRGKGHRDITALSSHYGLQQNYTIWPLVTIKNVVNGILFLPKIILAFSGYIQSHETPSSTRDHETPVRHRQQTQRITLKQHNI